MQINFKPSLLGLLASQWNAALRADGSRRLLTAPVLCITALALSGCLAQSQIQSKYMQSQDDCRNETARSVSGGETAQPVSENQQSPIAQRFATCMTKQGWHLSTPKPTVVAQNPPTGSPSTNPSAALAVPAQNYPSQSSYPPNPNPNSMSSYPQQIVTYPPSGAPSVNPSAAAARVAAPTTGAMAVPRNALTGSPGAVAGGMAPMTQPATGAPVAAVPSAARTAAAPASSVAAPAAQAVVKPAQTTIPASPDSTIYQPGRPATEATPFYGTGPGRQF